MNPIVNRFCAVLLGCTIILFSSCNKEDNPVTPVNPPVTGAYIIGTVYYPQYSALTNYNFLYPSTDPYGNPVMLSGTISMGPEVTKDNALGLVLYNHYSIFKSDDCPSKGKLDMQDKMRGSGFIVVSPDSYGFGSTANQSQTYCMARQNAQASVDALLAARQLLTQAGYRFGDALINIGYSQGAQTAIGVLRHISENNLDIHFIRTIAGAGPYDLTETYRQLIAQDAAGRSSNAVSVLLAYNEFAGLGLTYPEMFREPVLNHVGDWFLSKQYGRQEIDEMIGEEVKLTDCLAPALLDMESSASQRLIKVFEADNLCKGWTPRQDENILLFHSLVDDTVPYENTTLLYDFLTKEGVENIELDKGKYGILFEDSHTFASLTFINHTKEWFCDYFGIPQW